MGQRVERDEVRKGSWGQTGARPGCLSDRMVFLLRAVKGFSAAAAEDRLPVGCVEARRPATGRISGVNCSSSLGMERNGWI